MKVAIQGQKASFHDIAQREFFKSNQQVMHCETFQEVFDSVQSGSSDYGIAAIENSLYGSLNEVYDLLLKHKFWINGEIYLRIVQCLIGLPGSKLNLIKEVYSMPVAIGQCEEFLGENLPEATRIEHHDTTGSVIDVKKWGDPTRAAIAGEEAAQHYQMEILAKDIETNKQNYTRFIVFTKQRQARENTNKTSIVVRTDMDTKPGALYRTLGVFANRNINLTKIESRPIVGKAWHYMFYLDFDKGVDTAATRAALAELQEMAIEVTLLGSYEKGQIVE